MIGRITGRLLEKTTDFVLVDVGGVAYEMEIPGSTFEHLPKVDGLVTLHTHMVVREDAQLLYGFHSSRERELFRLLIKVNKVGPRVAVAILSSVETGSFIRCVREKDVKTLNAIPGVGKVMAERLIVEMSNKLPAWEVEIGYNNRAGSLPGDTLADAESALVQLGFKPQDAARALSLVESADADVESLIKQALRTLA